MQRLKSLFFCSFCQFVKYCFEFLVCSTYDKYGKCIPLDRIK